MEKRHCGKKQCCAKRSMFCQNIFNFSSIGALEVNFLMLKNWHFTVILPDFETHITRSIFLRKIKLTPFLKSADVQLSKNGLLFYYSKKNELITSI